MKTVGEIMTRRVVAAREDMPFKDLVALLHEHRVSGAPVVGEDGRLVGIVTEADLLIAGASEPQRRSRFVRWFMDSRFLAELEEPTRDPRVQDLMTRDVATVGPGTTVREAIRVLLRAGVKRLPVVDPEGRVVGIVSRSDLLSPFLRTDDDIRREIREEVILRTMWIDPSEVTVSVRSGIVRLSGRLERRSLKEILVELVRRVDGVVVVDDALSFATDDRDVDTGPVWGAPLPGALRGV